MNNKNKLMVSITAEEGEDLIPPPVDILAVLDISGSMSSSAAGKNDGSTVYIDLGYSLLDLLKHATNTIIKTMRP
jgi:hypothetical protein